PTEAARPRRGLERTGLRALRGVVPALERLVVVGPGPTRAGRTVAALGASAQLGLQLARLQGEREQIADHSETEQGDLLPAGGGGHLHRTASLGAWGSSTEEHAPRNSASAADGRRRLASRSHRGTPSGVTLHRRDQHAPQVRRSGTANQLDEQLVDAENSDPWPPVRDSRGPAVEGPPS